MSWVEICQDPTLRDLPYKVQTDKWGNIVMTPATNEHGIYQAKIVTSISNLLLAEADDGRRRGSCCRGFFGLGLGLGCERSNPGVFLSECTLPSDRAAGLRVSARMLADISRSL